MKTINIITLAVILLLTNSCATSYITSTWKAPDAGPKKYNKVMVLGIIREADRTMRQKMENHLVDDLKLLGYNAFSAYEQYGPKTFQDIDEKMANQKLAADGIDAVVTIVLLDKQKERHYVTGHIAYSPYTYYQNHVWGYYHSLSYRVGMSGYYEVTTKYFWESNLYDLSSNKLIYSAQTQSFDPSSVEGLAHEYGQKIIQNMVKGNVLQKQEQATVTKAL
ncbi:MAG: hypothetical protein ACXWCZ_04420 [Flavisolibacter sp.]